MTTIDDRARWLDALRAQRPHCTATLFERPPWNDAVRASSASVDREGVNTASPLEIHGGSQVHADPSTSRLQVALDDASREWLSSFDVPEGIVRWNERSTPPAPMLLSALLHDLKNSLGAQSLLLGSAERELKTAADGSRSLRFDPLLESIALCRESVAIAADRAQLAQWLLSATAPPSMSGETWLRLAVAGLSSDEREKLQRTVAPDARSGPRGDIRSLVSTATALCSVASSGERTAHRGQPCVAEVVCEGDELLLKVFVPSKALSREAFWAAATQSSASDGGSRSESVVGLSELLASPEHFSFVADPAVGTTVVVRAPRSSGVLR